MARPINARIAFVVITAALLSRSIVKRRLFWPEIGERKVGLEKRNVSSEMCFNCLSMCVCICIRGRQEVLKFFNQKKKKLLNVSIKLVIVFPWLVTYDNLV